MADIYKRKRLMVIFILTVSLICCSLALSCKESGGGEDLDDNASLSVHYLDVGGGDATLIKLPDNKVMLIDTGEFSEQNFDKISRLLIKYGGKIDYFILSHPDIEHFGNAVTLINNFSIGKVFIPKILNETLYPKFGEVLELLRQKGIETEISKTYLSLSTKDFALIFLSPNFDGEDSSYFPFNSSLLPSDTLSDNVSPTIYLEYKSYRFLFTADAGAIEEKNILTQYKLGLYKNVTASGWSVNLDNIDFYKLSAHGNSKANSYEFLSVLKPKNAVISVGGANVNADPSTEVLIRLQEVNPDYNLFRTDRDKTVSVFIDKNGSCTIAKG